MFCSLKNNTGDDLNLPIIDTAALQGLQTRAKEQSVEHLIL
jgi:hypothetical protein